MNIKLVLALILLSTVMACKKSETTNQTTTETVDTVPSQQVTECYRWVTVRDTVSMTMNRSGNKVSGELIYKWFEKDGNTGDYRGSFKGDTLRIGYTFQSEGMTSIREELFLLKGNELIKGSGNIIEKDGRQVFENRNNVVFDRSMVLTKSDCK